MFRFRSALSLLVATLAVGASACRSRGRDVETTAAAAPAVTVDASAGGMSCEALRSLALPHVTIAEARVVPEDVAQKVPAHCRVLGASHPTGDSDIRFVVAVPLGAAWNGRYQQVGSGGFSGFLPDDDVLEGLAAGNAVAGTDDGHEAAGNDARWAVGHPEKLIDYGYRALKETTDAARAIVRAFTGRAPSRSYFTGCSDGGREALMEAQRFPDDFDGIVAEAPALDATRLLAAMAWNALALDRTPGSYLSPAKLVTLQAAARRACGDAEGVVEDPPSCHFDPGALACHGPETDACLTEAQLTTVRAIYGGAKNPRTGEAFQPGFEPGAEAERGSWREWLTGMSREGAKGAEQRMLGTGFLQSMLIGDPAYDVRKVDFDRDVTRAITELGPILDARDPDLRRFAKRGKLIVFHGWSDPAIPPRDSIAYYDRVGQTMGDPRAFFRLFLAPGMLHCGGGPGPNVVPALAAVEAWVEKGAAPESLVATKYEGEDPSKAALRAWPLCVYPARATWDGKGDRAKAESWRCAPGEPAK
jgi:feruloyl esterase